jgi:toxin FitB
LTSYLLDTNVVGDFARPEGHAAVDEWMGRHSAPQLYVSTITVGEIAFGIERLPDGRRKAEFRLWFERLLRHFEDRLLPFDQNVAIAWGRLRARLREAGQEKPAIDLQIAAVALHHGLTLVTGNERDFSGLDLPVINPWTSNRTPSP